MQSEYGVPVEMNPGIDILPGAPAVRRRFEAVPYNGSTFVPEDTVQIYLPTGGASTFIDPHRSYLRFDIENNSGMTGVDLSDFVYTLPPGLNAENSGAMFWLDPSIGAQNFIRELRIYQAGLPIEEITDYDNIATVLAETEFGDAINSGLALQMWGAGGCYKVNYGSASFGGMMTTLRSPNIVKRAFNDQLRTTDTTQLDGSTDAFDTYADGAFNNIVSTGEYMGDVFIKFLKPTNNAGTAIDDTYGLDGYTNEVRLMIDDTNNATNALSGTNFYVAKGICTLADPRNKHAGSNYTTENTVYADHSHWNKIVGHNPIFTEQHSHSPYWQGMFGVQASNGVGIYPTQAYFPSNSYKNLAWGTATSGFTGGQTTKPFWERAVAIPSSSLSTNLVAGHVAGKTTGIGQPSEDGYLQPDDGALNSIRVCIPIISGVVGYEATKYFPSMLLASQSFYIELKLADYFGAIGNALNANAVLAGAHYDNGHLYQTHNGHNEDLSTNPVGTDTRPYALSKPYFTTGEDIEQVEEGNYGYPANVMYQAGNKFFDSASWSSSASWRLKNIAFVGEEIISTPELTNELFSVSSRQPIRWTTTSYRNYSQYLTCTSNSDSFDLVLPTTLQSVQRLTHTFRMKDTLSNPMYRRNFRVNPAVSSFQYRIGAEVFPQQPHTGQKLSSMHDHPFLSGKSSESAVELLKSLHLTTGQGTNFVDGFSDNTSWNASLDGHQVMMKPLFLESDTATIWQDKSVKATFPLGSSYSGTDDLAQPYRFFPDYGNGNMLGSYLLAFDFNVYGGASGTSRCGRSFQSDQVNMIFTLDKSKRGIRNDANGIYRPPFFTSTVPNQVDMVTVGGTEDLVVGCSMADYPITPVYKNTELLMNTIAKYDMVLTILPEGTMQPAY